MSSPTHDVNAPGDPRHPDHEAWLTELGRATYTATRVAGISFDILRIFGEVPDEELVMDTLGRLLNKLKELSARGVDVAGLSAFTSSFERSLVDRNDLLHALPVKDGLLRRVRDDPSYVREFYTVEQLHAVTEQLTETWRLGSEALYSDGGRAVRAWTMRS